LVSILLVGRGVTVGGGNVGVCVGVSADVFVGVIVAANSAGPVAPELQEEEPSRSNATIKIIHLIRFAWRRFCVFIQYSSFFDGNKKKTDDI